LRIFLTVERHKIVEQLGKEFYLASSRSVTLFSIRLQKKQQSAVICVLCVNDYFFSVLVCSQQIFSSTRPSACLLFGWRAEYRSAPGHLSRDSPAFSIFRLPLGLR
jgi:hypothetical protein